MNEAPERLLPDLTPPHDLDAERALLGACLISREAIDTASQRISPADFYDRRHELVYAAIERRYATLATVDQVSICDDLRSELPRMGGPAFIYDLVMAPGALVGNTDAHATIVARLAAKRHILTLHLRGLQRALDTADTDTTPEQLLEDTRADLDAIPAGVPGIDQSAVPSNEASIQQALDDLEASPGIPTPWDYLTNTLAGWKPGCLYLIGARPAVGKSVAGNTIALDVARRGHAALLYSLEMSRSEIYHRLLAAVGGVDMSKIQHRRLREEDWKHLTSAAQHLAGLPLLVDDRAHLSISQVTASIKAQQQTRQVGVVIIDYLQLLAPPEGTPRQDRRVQVDAISRNLKALAKDCNVPVIALTQLNRSPESRADKTPTLSDLREAGGQEQDADVVILMHRDLTGRDSPATELKLVVGKNRHGPVSALELFFRGEHSRIEEAPWSPSAHLTKDQS